MYGPPSFGQPLAPFSRQEVVLFNGPGVQVTSARLIVGAQTYPIGGITAVSSFVVPPQKGSAILFAVWSGFWAVVWIGVAAMGGAGAGTVLMVLLSLACAGISMAVAAGKRGTFGIVVSTAGMNVRAYVSENGELVQQILGAINQALAMR